MLRGLAHGDVDERLQDAICAESGPDPSLLHKPPNLICINVLAHTVVME
jgi:hypothetical protein